MKQKYNTSNKKHLLKGTGICRHWAAILPVMLFLLCGQTLAQTTVLVKGVVSDQQGEPIIGASILEKGMATNGTITDYKGNFQIRVSRKATLIISYIGYESREVAAVGGRSLHIVLSENVKQLEEVVVVGYGTQKKVSVTGAISSASTAELKKSSAARLDNALAGRISGLISTQKGGGQPGVDQATIYLRGLSTFNGSQPLILIDGVKRNTIGEIDPNEVESISVLKDASATAVFGVRGANGVIIITTKRGQKGKPKLSASVEQSFTSFATEHDQLHSWDYMTFRNEALVNDGIEKQYDDEIIEKFRNPLWGLDPSDPDYSRKVAERRYLYCDHNYLEEFFKKYSPQTKVNANVSGGTDRVAYFLNAGYVHQGGNLKTESKDKLGYDPSAKMDRWNFRINLDYHITSSLKAALNIGTYIETVNMPNAGPLYQNNTAAMMSDLFQNISVMLPIQAGPVTMEGFDVPAGMVVHPSHMDRSPYEIINRRGSYSSTHINLNSQFALEWDLSKLVTKGLSIKGMVAYDSYGSSTKNSDKVENDYLVVPNYEDGTFGYALNTLISSPLAISKSHGTNYSINAQASVNYHRLFGEVHDVGAMIVAQRDYWESGAQIPFNVLGIAARATYAYDARYLLEFDMGYNGSEQFAPSKRFGFFPAVSLGWVVSNEAFMKHARWLDNLKLRFSAGRVGNDRMGDKRFLYLDNVTIRPDRAVSGLGSEAFGSVSQGLLGNPNLTWELADKRNYGIDISIFRQLSLSLDYFTEKRTQILISRGAVPAFQGVPLDNIPKANIGRIDNKGFEMELTYNKTLFKDWHLHFKANFATNKNKVLFADEPKRTEDYACRYRTTGYSLGQNWGYRIDYSTNGGYWVSEEEIKNSGLTYVFGVPRPGDFKYIDQNGDKVIDEKDQMPIKHTTIPGINYGFSFTTAYKGFDFSVFFQGLARYSMYYSGHGVFENIGQGFYYNYQRHPWSEERWANHGKITYPALTATTSTSLQPNDFFIQNRAFLRLKNMELGYTIPKSWSGAIGIQSCRLFVSGQNLFCWDRLKTDHLDPEQDSPAAYPITKMFNFGLNVNF